MIYQIFPLPQVKRSAIVNNKQGMYKLPHELPNDLRLKTAILSAKVKILLTLAKNSWKTEIKFFP